MMALAQMVEEPMFFTDMAEAENPAPSRELQTLGDQDPGPLRALQVVSAGGRLRPSSDLTLLFLFGYKDNTRLQNRCSLQLWSES